jgi:DNA invertase Pin-like site-specific DNA recombinase
MIAQRTKDALQAAKARGVVLGNPKLDAVCDRAVASVKADADRFATNVRNSIDRRCITSRHCTVTERSRRYNGSRWRLDGGSSRLNLAACGAFCER